MSTTVSDHVWSRAQQWGVRRVFGYPGDGINGLIGALDRTHGAIEFVQARHEEMAAFMACGHAKYTGQPGVCIATSGPGAIHLLNGLYDARLDHQPVVAMVGQAARAAMGGQYQQETDLQNLFKDVAGAFVQTAMSPAQVKHLVDRAFRIAVAERTVTCIILPKDLQEEKAMPEPPQMHDTVHTGLGYEMPDVLPDSLTLRRAADVLNAGSKVAMLVGAGALHATEEVIEVAERLSAGVAKALLGKAVVPDDLPYVTGSVGLLGTAPSYQMMMECDTLFMIGSGFPYSEFLPRIGSARGVQIDLAPRMLSLRYPMEVAMVGDSAKTLRALLPMLKPKTDRSWRTRIERNVAGWWKVLEARAMNAASPLNPQRVFWELSPRLPDGVILAADSGSATDWYARDLKMRRGMMASLSGGLASMGSGMPYAIAAKFAHPNRPVMAVVGDGAMQMNGMNELITVAKYWKQWADRRFIVLVLNNRDLNQVTWEMRAQSGDPKFEASQSLPDVPYHRYAELLGLQGLFVDRPDQVASTLDQAMLAPSPVVVEAYTDPNVPPLPPHITLKNAKAFTRTLLSVDPEESSMLAGTVKELLARFRPVKS